MEDDDGRSVPSIGMLGTAATSNDDMLMMDSVGFDSMMGMHGDEDLDMMMHGHGHARHHPHLSIGAPSPSASPSVSSVTAMQQQQQQQQQQHGANANAAARVVSDRVTTRATRNSNGVANGNHHNGSSSSSSSSSSSAAAATVTSMSLRRRGGRRGSNNNNSSNGVVDRIRSPALTVQVPSEQQRLTNGAPFRAGDSLKAPLHGTYRPCEVVQADARHHRYYVHFVGLNRRLDRWVAQRELREYKSADELNKMLRTMTPGGMSPASPEVTGRRVTRRDKRKFKDISLVGINNQGIERSLHELEKEHEEHTKVKNIDTVQFGKYCIDAWYFSPYPDEFCADRRLYVCEFCMKYMKRLKTLEKHKKVCAMKHPPGNEIYRKNKISVFEVDGAQNKVYCQCLCLFAKLFLDHKTLYYDVAPFLFYVLTEHDKDGYHIVGYFSKEKNSAENNNVACILTFPQHQRKGYGRFLISLSYELSKRERTVGSPEKPLSDLGKVSYRSYWISVLIPLLRDHQSALSISDLSLMTGIKTDDVISALQYLELLRYCKGQHVIAVSPKVVEQHYQQVVARKRKHKCVLDPDCLYWRPPAFDGHKQGGDGSPQSMDDASSSSSSAAAAASGASSSSSSSNGRRGRRDGGSSSSRRGRRHRDSANADDDDGNNNNSTISMMDDAGAFKSGLAGMQAMSAASPSSSSVSSSASPTLFGNGFLKASSSSSSSSSSNGVQSLDNNSLSSGASSTTTMSSPHRNHAHMHRPMMSSMIGTLPAYDAHSSFIAGDDDDDDDGTDGVHMSKKRRTIVSSPSSSSSSRTSSMIM